MARLASAMVKLTAVAAAMCIYIYPALASVPESSVHGATRRTAHGHLALARSANASSDNSTQVAVTRQKRDPNAKFTNFVPGLNGCGGTSSSGDFIVALNAQQYGNGEHCFEMITVSFEGKSTQAKIVDECPGCPYNGLDLSPAVFSAIADINLGVIYGDWEYGAGAPPPSPPPPPKPSHPPPPPPSSTSQSIEPTPTTTSTSATLTSASTSAPLPSFPPETNNIEALGLLVVQLGGMVAAGAGQADAPNAISTTA